MSSSPLATYPQARELAGAEAVGSPGPLSVSRQHRTRDVAIKQRSKHHRPPSLGRISHLARSLCSYLEDVYCFRVVLVDRELFYR